MKLDIKTKGRPAQVALTISVSSPKNVRVVAYDKMFPKTILWDRTALNDGTESLLIKMPLSPKICSVLIFDADTGSAQKDTGITLVSQKKSALKRELSENQIHDHYFREFVKFAEQFAYNAQYLETGKTYESNHRHYAINYVDTIMSAEGAPMTTPARIKEDSGYMQFAKSRLRDFTVPGIIAIELHEFSHNFLNQNSEDEEEADLNSLITYLGLGFPLVEAYKAWENIYEYTNTPMNKARSTKVTDLLLEYSQELGTAA